MRNFLKSVAKRFIMLWRLKVYGLKDVPGSVYLAKGSRFHSSVKFGDYVFVNYGCDVGPHVIFSNYVMVGPGVLFAGNDHRFDIVGSPIIFSGRPDEIKETIIEADVWIGGHSVILAGVHIGVGSIVAANSVVTSDIPPFSIYAGVPARFLKWRFDSEVDRIGHLDSLKLNSNRSGGHYVAPFVFK